MEISRDRANKVIKRLRKSLKASWKKHDEVLLKYLRQKDELSNSLWREKHYLIDFYRWKDVNFEQIRKDKEQVVSESWYRNYSKILEDRTTHLINKNQDLWLKLNASKPV